MEGMFEFLFVLVVIVSEFDMVVRVDYCGYKVLGDGCGCYIGNYDRRGVKEFGYFCF